MSYATGDEDITKSLKASITSEKNVSIDFVVNEATSIYILSKAVPYDENSREQFMSKMNKLHPQFSKSYPIVLRYIIMLGAYSPKVFKLWLQKIALTPWRNEEEYLEAQVTYISNLYRHVNPRAKTSDIVHHRDGIRKMLLDEHKQFKKYAEKYSAEVTANEEEFHKRNKAELTSYLASASADELLRAGTIRMESECNSENTNKYFTTEIDVDMKKTSINSDDLLA